LLLTDTVGFAAAAAAFAGTLQARRGHRRGADCHLHHLLPSDAIALLLLLLLVCRRDAATGEVRIGIFTTRDVGVEEELTYDYMFEHYGLSGMAQGFKCQCGAKNCRCVTLCFLVYFVSRLGWLLCVCWQA
jgi:hypothetical protein